MRRAVLAPLLLVLLPASAAAAPAPAISASAASGPAPLTIRFAADAAVVDPAPAIVSYAWSFGDGTTGSGQTVSHRFGRAGLFTVGLTVTDALGGTGTATTHVEAQALALRIGPAAVVFGRRPARAGAAVAIERRSAGGWTRIASARTDSAGRFNARLRPGKTGVLRARIGALRSPAIRLAVAPELRARAGAGVAFVGAPLVVRARPVTSSAFSVTVLRAGRPVARTHGRPGTRLIVPTPGVGAFAARIELAGGTLTVPLRATARTLTYGSTGADVVALRARLAELHVHVPSPSRTFGSELADSVVAFQKARGLERTGTVDETTWRALSQDVVPAAALPGAGHAHRGLEEPADPDDRPERRDALVPTGLLRRGRDHAGRQLPDPLEGARDHDVAQAGDPLPDDDVPHALRDPRVPIGPDLSSQPRLRAGADLARRLAVPAVAGR
jgi:PKD repeat protein